VFYLYIRKSRRSNPPHPQTNILKKKVPDNIAWTKLYKKKRDKKDREKK
jgi:ribosomal protein L24E